MKALWFPEGYWDDAGNGDLLEVTVLARGRGVRLAGEVDMSNHDLLRAALAPLLAAPGHEIHVDLAALRFIDVGGVRELVRLARPRPAPRLVLHDPPPLLRRLIFLLWQDLNLEIRTSVFPPATGREDRRTSR